MITDFSQTALNSGMLAAFLNELAFPKTSQETYDALMPDVRKVLGETPELASIELPSTVDEMREQEESIVGSIMERLGGLRSRVGGDVLPSTIFMMTHSVCRGVLFAAFDDQENWQPYRTLLLCCLDDVGIDGEPEVQVFEKRSLALVQHEGEETTLSNTDRRELVQETIASLWERIHQRWSEPVAVSEQLAAISAQVKELHRYTEEFRRESHEEHEEILETLSQLHDQLLSRLKAQGIPEAKAEALSDVGSETFLERLKRWACSSKARNAAEAALWTALDFVPAGTTVKLGIKLASAVRKATK